MEFLVFPLILFVFTYSMYATFAWMDRKIAIKRIELIKEFHYDCGHHTVGGMKTCPHLHMGSSTGYHKELDDEIARLPKWWWPEPFCWITESLPKFEDRDKSL